MTNAITIGLSGLNAASSRLNASASNIANAYTVGSLESGEQAPYTPVESVQTARDGGGVDARLVSRNNPIVSAYAPDSPFADEKGLVGVPNVDLVSDVVNLNLAKVAYKASLAVIETAQALDDELLNIFDEKV